VKQKKKILRIKKGAKRLREQLYRQEAKMEFDLHREFVIARSESQLISGRWFKLYAKALYHKIYPLLISQDEITRRFLYQGFSFSSTWFLSFRTRYQIKMRCKTKQAQKPLEDFREKIKA
jgi:hypothetical protein